MCRPPILVCLTFLCLGVVGAHTKPPFINKAGTARWLVHSADYVFQSTISVALGGAPFGNVQSMSDGTVGANDNSTGVPYFYVSPLDTSMVDIAANPAVSLSVTEEMINASCTVKKLDAEDPRCARVTLSGRMVEVTDAVEAAAARAALFSRHPVMASWPGDHAFAFWKVEISNIWLIDFFGGAANITTAEYFKAKPLLPAHYIESE